MTSPIREEPRKSPSWIGFKKETLAQLFSCEFCEISLNTFFYRTSLVAACVIKSVNDSNHGTIIQTGITCEKFFHKSLLNSAWLWSRTRLVINKKQKYFPLANHHNAEWKLDSWVWFVGKDKNRIKSNLWLNLWQF